MLRRVYVRFDKSKAKYTSDLLVDGGKFGDLTKAQSAKIKSLTKPYDDVMTALHVIKGYSITDVTKKDGSIVRLWVDRKGKQFFMLLFSAKDIKPSLV